MEDVKFLKKMIRNVEMTEKTADEGGTEQQSWIFGSEKLHRAKWISSWLRKFIIFGSMFVFAFIIHHESMVHPDVERKKTIINQFELAVVNRTIHEKMVNKRILFWNHDKGVPIRERYYTRIDYFSECPVSKCSGVWRFDNTLPVTDYDAIVFHGKGLNNYDLPRERTDAQRYIFYSREPPDALNMNNDIYDGYFNWTMSYRFDADIVKPFAIVRDKRTGKPVAPTYSPKWINPRTEYKDDGVMQPFHDEDLMNAMKQKTGTVAWFAAKCDTRGKRERYIQYLELYMNIDIFGRCSRSPVNRHCDPKHCHQRIFKSYYFYLTFESSLCRYYATAKLFHTLQTYVIPVVYGGATYEGLAPPHSYINALDFPSPKHLAEYLTYLSRTPEEYAKYFWWRRYYSVDTTNRTPMCKLCEMLHNKNAPAKTVENFHDWYRPYECVPPKIFKQTVNRKKVAFRHEPGRLCASVDCLLQRGILEKNTDL